jgi:hypothetical protein
MCKKEVGMKEEEHAEGEGSKVVSVQSLSNAELIKLLQFEIGGDDLTAMVEAELERRRTEGTKQ